MMKHLFIYSLACALFIVSCSEDSMRIDKPVADQNTTVCLHAEIDQLNPTRADDSGFADGDVIGVYAVDFENGQPGKLLSVGNNADNLQYRLCDKDNAWNGEREILFSDDNTPMDIIGYYPYSRNISDVESYPISVSANQNGDNKEMKMNAYEASDFLWAKASCVTSSAPNVILTFKHVLSSVRVTLNEGDGFDEGEWTDLEKSVIIRNTVRDANVNLSNGEVTLSGQKDQKGIVAKKDRNDYRGIVIPQDVEAGDDILVISVGSSSYSFVKSDRMTYHPSRQHNFTIEVTKKSSSGDLEFILTDESITPWESDLSSHDGSAKEYVVVDIENGEDLSIAVVRLGLDAKEIVNLKVRGRMIAEDFEYIRNNMESLEAINLQEVDLSECGDSRYGSYYLPEYAFVQMQTLKTCVFPEKVKVIGALAFYGTSLSGSLNLPEGIEIIEDMAFSNYYNENGGASFIPGGQIISHNNLNGTLNLPSTLKSIGWEAFRGCDFSGTLSIPESVEAIGNGAFADCKRFTGDIHFPSGITDLGEETLSGMTGINGWVVLPENITELKSYSLANTNVAGIEWPKNLRSIGYGAFSGSNFKNDIALPESVIKLGEACFRMSKIKHVILPPNLTVIPSLCFYYCNELTDTITIPDKVEVIETSAFDNCKKLEALVLPSSLKRIDGSAFYSCFNLNYIRCDAVDPPSVDESAFWGVEKDNFTLEVPEQSVDAYRSAPGWSEFKRISAYRNFVARPSKYNVLNKGGKKEIILNADASWEMIECPSWCHIDKTSGNQKTVITLTVDALAKNSQSRFGDITFRLNGSDDYFTHINVGQYDYQYDEDEYLTLQSASKGKGIDLVFIGDGYDAADIANGTYLNDMKQEAEYFFCVEPYTTYREYFNVYTAFALSEDSGVETLNTWRNTKFNVIIRNCGSDERMSADWEKALNYCAEHVSPTVESSEPALGCILVANSELYEGLTYSAGNSFCAVVTKSTENYPYDARGIVQHEAGGHGIGWLADEYTYHYQRIQKCGCTCCGHVFELTNYQSGGFGLNLSFIGKYKEVPWSHLAFHSSYGDIVDVYEGGYFHSRGVYRSEYNSCMNNNVPYFSTWSRQLIVQRIMKLAGEQFDMNSFYAKDSRAVGRDFTSTSRSGASKTPEVPVRHGNAPIMIKGYKYGKKGGRK